MDAVWSLKQGYLLRGGAEEGSPALVELKQLLSKLLVKAENRQDILFMLIEFKRKTKDRCCGRMEY